MTVTGRVYSTPAPRPPIADPSLVRPDWRISGCRDPKLLWLDKNENADPVLGALVERVLVEVAPSAVRTYPDLGPLYHKLAGFLGIGADRLVLASGSDGAIRTVFETFVQPGDVVLHTSPTFAMYPVYCRMYGVRAVTMEYQASPQGPALSPDQLIAAIQRVRPRLVCLPNPDSPTGSIFEPTVLRSIVEAAGAAGAMVLVDEAYHPFYGATALSWIDACPHLVVARTFSKAWGLAGLRIGYAAAAPEVTRLLHKVRAMYEVGAVAAAVADRMLDHADDVLASVGRLNAGRDVFRAAMETLYLGTFPVHGNFAHVSFGDHAAAVHAALADLVLYRRDFAEPCLRGFSRFTAAPAEILTPVIERIRGALRGGVMERA